MQKQLDGQTNLLTSWGWIILDHSRLAGLSVAFGGLRISPHVLAPSPITLGTIDDRRGSCHVCTSKTFGMRRIVRR